MRESASSTTTDTLRAPYRDHRARAAEHRDHLPRRPREDHPGRRDAAPGGHLRRARGGRPLRLLGFPPKLTDPADRSRYPLRRMAERDDKQAVVAAQDMERAIKTSTLIDEDELIQARLDDRWREFCRNAEDYVAETTRRRPRIEQPA